MLELQCIRTEKEFLSLEPLWNGLLEKSGISVNRTFYTFEFARTWLTYFLTDCELLALVIKKAGQPVAILPLVKHAKKDFTQVRLLGGDSLDYHDFIMAQDREECIGAALDFLSKDVRSWDLFSLDNIPVDSPNFPALKKYGEENGRWARIEEFDSAPHVRVESGWDDFINNVDRRIRSDTNRQLRRLCELGELHYGKCKGPEEIAVLMDKLFEYKNRRYRDTGRQGAFEDKRKRDFYLDLARALWEKDRLELSYLQLNDELLAIHFGSVFQGKLYYWLPAFNPEYNKYSPSRILLMNLLKQAFDSGITEFDFGFGREPYKYEWAGSERKLYRFLYFNKTAKGLLLREWFQSWRGVIRKNRGLHSFSKSIEKVVAGR
ncbi:MAG: GNAT family N-acetyltransferase [Nitrospiraceae bacterium]|nr:MAG: GNAT family N-acetyltransferase [Nitrospiraceae bacterium]